MRRASTCVQRLNPNQVSYKDAIVRDTRPAAYRPQGEFPVQPCFVLLSLSFGAWQKQAGGKKGSERDLNSGGKTRGHLSRIWQGFAIHTDDPDCTLSL